MNALSGIAALAFLAAADLAGLSKDSMISIVARIQKADYEGDRKALASLKDELAPFAQEGPLVSRAHYWRGFAMWRRALNGFNDKADKTDLGADLKSCVAEFQAALAADSGLTDAKVGEASCTANLAFLESSRTGFLRQWELLREAQKEAPKNPRLAWALGAAQFYAPPAYGGGQELAISTYEAGLASAKQERVTDPLDPSWGEPELLMNLAFANANRAQPDLESADKYAHSALALVPYWHYVRDILVPQIQEAKAKRKSR